MGDWTKSRKGLTKRERGIPLGVLRKIIKGNSLRIISEKKGMFPLTRRLKFINKCPFNSKFLVFLDAILSRLFSWNNRYHSTRFYHKLQPQSIFYVLGKDI